MSQAQKLAEIDRVRGQTRDTRNMTAADRQTYEATNPPGGKKAR